MKKMLILCLSLIFGFYSLYANEDLGLDYNSALNNYGGFYNAPNIPNKYAFAALKKDGSIVSWGDKDWGGRGAPRDKGFIQINGTNVDDNQMIIKEITNMIDNRLLIFNNNDSKIRTSDATSVIGLPATYTEFGGYNTPLCKLAISNDGKYFFLKKVNSTCKKLINSKGKKIICNSNMSICKTRDELKEAVWSYIN